MPRKKKTGGIGCIFVLILLAVMAVMAVFQFIGEKIVQLGEYLAIPNFSLYLAFSVFIIIAITFPYFFIYRPLKKVTTPEQSVIADENIIELDPKKIKPLLDTVTFPTKIAGVTFRNKDGTKRQDLIKQLNPDEPLILKREPDNPYGDTAIAIYNSSGQQLGYIPSGDYLLAKHMDMGDKVSAKVLEVTGGFSYKKNYGCNIQVTKYFYYRYLDHQDTKIHFKLNQAKEIEKEDQRKAIELYRELIAKIKELDSCEPGFRSVRYPINRLSLVLEKLEEYQNAYDEINQYEQYEYYNGLSKSDKEAVIKRKIRLEKKLKKVSE
jgi:hypothetical protein